MSELNRSDFSETNDAVMFSFEGDLRIECRFDLGAIGVLVYSLPRRPRSETSE